LLINSQYNTSEGVEKRGGGQCTYCLVVAHEVNTGTRYTACHEV